MSTNDSDFCASVIIRGNIYSENLIAFGGRGEGGFQFYSPDPQTFIDELPLVDPTRLSDLYDLTFSDILDYLEELGARLKLETNPHLQKALEGSYLTAPTTPPIIKYSYQSLATVFSRESVTEMAEKTVGIEYLESWVPTRLVDGRTAKIRAFGSRALHVVAGNAPMVSAMTIIRNAISRSDGIIKSPSNDPFTALAIVQTMCDMAPDHPLTKHISVAYWKGGDEAFEKQLYQPHNIEKIIAWGGFASVKHVTRYIQPGLELISLDPKRSISIIGRDAFDDSSRMREAAEKLAMDFGALNQVGCVNSRIAYVETGTDAVGLEAARKFGEYAYSALFDLPEHISTKPKEVNRELKANIEALRFQHDWYHVIGGEDDEGAVIVSLLAEPVGFAVQLENRTINIVPVDSLDEALKFCDAYTQTVGIYPESVKAELNNKLPLHGVQRIVSLGYATAGVPGLPADAIEPLRRACKWIVDEETVSEQIAPTRAGVMFSSRP